MANLWGEKIKVNATIHTPGGLSAHADQRGLINWYSNFKNRPQLVLVHGEPESQSILSNTIQTELGIHVEIADYNQTLEL